MFDYELGKIERRDQMRVANILTNLKWKKAGQKQHQGKRQVVWIPIPPPKSNIVEEVLQSETKTEKEISIISIPTTPFVSNTETENKSALNRNDRKPKKDNCSGVEVQINWLTYPYQSKDIYTLKNRANKVKERLRGCSTKNDLVSLYAQGAITETEVQWLKNNLLSNRESDRLVEVEFTQQTNLFDQDRHEELKAQTTKEVRRIGLGKKQGIAYIKERYGVSDRAQMSIEQLVEFRDYLRSLPDK